MVFIAPGIESAFGLEMGIIAPPMLLTAVGTKISVVGWDIESCCKVIVTLLPMVDGVC